MEILLFAVILFLVTAIVAIVYNTNKSLERLAMVIKAENVFEARDILKGEEKEESEVVVDVSDDEKMENALRQIQMRHRERLSS